MRPTNFQRFRLAVLGLGTVVALTLGLSRPAAAEVAVGADVSVGMSFAAGVAVADCTVGEAAAPGVVAVGELTTDGVGLPPAVCGAAAAPTGAIRLNRSESNAAQAVSRPRREAASDDDSVMLSGWVAV